MLVFSPVFEADLQPEQYGYRELRSAQDAVKRIHRPLNQGHQELVDSDLSKYFGETPHVVLMKSLSRRISNGRMLRLLKAWTNMPVVEKDETGGNRRTNRVWRERKGTPRGQSDISAVEQYLHAPLYSRLEAVGLWPTICAQRKDANSAISPECSTLQHRE